MIRNLTRSNSLIIVMIVLLCFITRLPQMRSVHFMMDGDECIEGLMAKHMYEGKDIPFFFYGQNYGFSFVETTAIAGTYALFGVSDLSVKSAMLFLWCIGVVFFYKTLYRLSKGNAMLSFLMTLMLILCPAWSVWSMKARGGYLTSFMCSSVLLYLLCNEKIIRGVAGSLFAGLLLVVIYVSQPLWLPGLLPFVIYVFFKKENRKSILFTGVGVLLSVFAFRMLPFVNPGFFRPQVFDFNLTAEDFKHVPELLFMQLHGFYFFEFNYYDSAPLATIVFAWLFMLLLPALFAAAVYRLYKRKFSQPVFFIAFVSVLLTLSYVPFLNLHVARYLLPLTVFVLVALFALLKDVPQKISFAVIAPFIVIGVFSVIGFKAYKVGLTDKKELSATINYCKAHNANYVFCTHGMMQWQLMFYSKESLIARYYYPTDRYPEYVQRVNKAFAETPEQTAIIGFWGDFRFLQPSVLTNLQNGYFVYLHPGKEMVDNAGFEF